MSDSLEVFMEDISLLPGWILRNLSLMREIDLKGNETQNKLEEKRSTYLKEISNSSQLGVCASSENKLNEIKELQKEIKALFKEKLAISDQSIHFIRYDGEILRKYFEQLGETLTESYVGTDHNNASTSHTARLSISDTCQNKISSKGGINVETDSFSLNVMSTDRNFDRYFGNSLSNPRVIKTQSNNTIENKQFPQQTLQNNECLRSKKRKASIDIHTPLNSELLSKNNKNLSIEPSKSRNNRLIERKDHDLHFCSICEGSELPNNKLLPCSFCSENAHVLCFWMMDPNICRECFKKESIQLKSTYEIGYLTSNLNTPKSEQAKISKISKKK